MRPQYVLAAAGAAFAIPLSLFVVSTISATPSAPVAAFAPVGDIAPSATPRSTQTSIVTPRATDRPVVSVSPKASGSAHTVATTKPKPNGTVSEPAVSHSPIAKARAKAQNAPMSGWKAPLLVRGTNDISAPIMANGQRAISMVACIPSAACTVYGSTLNIGNDATSVTVRWFAPSDARWDAWSTTETFG